jgi:type IV pilus assembly protein PilV
MHMKKYMHMQQHRHCQQHGYHARMTGFTLVEVLVALIIIAVGMLGLAKIQALAYASTGIAGSQSLAALQASSLVSAMRANRSYWSTVATPFTLNVAVLKGVSTTVTSSDAALTGAPVCTAGGTTSAPCTPVQVASYDINDATTGWVQALSAVLPNPTATVNCPTPAVGTQLGCYIQITWTENNVTVNSQTQGANATALQTQAYTVFVVP